MNADKVREIEIAAEIAYPSELQLFQRQAYHEGATAEAEKAEEELKTILAINKALGEDTNELYEEVEKWKAAATEFVLAIAEYDEHPDVGIERVDKASNELNSLLNTGKV